MKQRLTLGTWMNDVPRIRSCLLVNDNRRFVRLMWVSRMRRIAVRRMALRWILNNRTVIGIVVGRRRSILLVSGVDGFRLINRRLILRRIDCDAAGRDLRLRRSRRDIRHVVLVNSGRVVRRCFLNRQRRIIVRLVNRWRLICVVICASFVSFRLVKHRRILRWIAVGIVMQAVWLGYFVSVRPNSCGYFRFRLRQNVIGELNILEGGGTRRVLHANDLIVVDIFRNGHHLIVDRTCLGNVSLRIRYRCGRNSARSGLGDKMLIVRWCRRNRAARLSIQSVVVVRDVALGC